MTQTDSQEPERCHARIAHGPRPRSLEDVAAAAAALEPPAAHMRRLACAAICGPNADATLQPSGPPMAAKRSLPSGDTGAVGKRSRASSPRGTASLLLPRRGAVQETGAPARPDDVGPRSKWEASDDDSDSGAAAAGGHEAAATVGAPLRPS